MHLLLSSSEDIPKLEDGINTDVNKVSEWAGLTNEGLLKI